MQVFLICTWIFLHVEVALAPQQLDVKVVAKRNSHMYISASLILIFVNNITITVHYNHRIGLAAGMWHNA